MGNLSAGSVFAEDLANSLAELWLSSVCAHLARADAPEKYVLTWDILFLFLLFPSTILNLKSTEDKPSKCFIPSVLCRELSLDSQVIKD